MTVKKITKGQNKGLFQFKNGVFAKKLPNGRYQIVKGADKEYLDKIRSKKGVAHRRPRVKSSGTHLRSLYREAYRNLPGKSVEQINKAMLRDWNSRSKSKKTLDLRTEHSRRMLNKYPNRFLKYDLPGFDDGSGACGDGDIHCNAPQIRRLPKRRVIKKKKQSGGANKPIDLKTAVNLLRNYYDKKYN